MDHKMFCFQCQEAAGCTGCTQAGVCGKKPSTAKLQDLLLYATRGLCQSLSLLREQGKAADPYISSVISENLFVTITNANFDDDKIKDRIDKTLSLTKNINSQLTDLSSLGQEALWLSLIHI